MWEQVKLYCRILVTSPVTLSGLSLVKHWYIRLIKTFMPGLHADLLLYVRATVQWTLFTLVAPIVQWTVFTLVAHTSVTTATRTCWVVGICIITDIILWMNWPCQLYKPYRTNIRRVTQTVALTVHNIKLSHYCNYEPSFSAISHRLSISAKVLKLKKSFKYPHGADLCSGNNQKIIS